MLEMVLEDGRPLASLDILKESTLHLIFDPSVIQVLVKTPLKETLKLQVKPLFTVFDVKSVVGSMMGSPIYGQALFYEGKQLEDSKSLAHYNIKEESVLEILPAFIPIFVRTFTGKSITLSVSPSDTVSEVLERVFRKLKLPAKYCPLFLSGKRLEGGQSLVSYSIQKHSTLFVGSVAVRRRASR